MMNIREHPLLFHHNYTHYFFYYFNYFKCLSRFPMDSNATYMLQHNVQRSYVLSQAKLARRKVQLFAEVHHQCVFRTYYSNYSTIILIILAIIHIILWLEIAIWVSIHCRNSAHWLESETICITHRHPRPKGPGQRRNERMQPPLHRRSGCMRASQHAWQYETHHPSHPRIGQWRRACPATRDPREQDPDATEKRIMRIM